MNTLTVRELRVVDDVYDLRRSEVIPAKIGDRGPWYFAVVERPSDQIRLVSARPDGNIITLFEEVFDPRSEDVGVGGLGGLKKVGLAVETIYVPSSEGYGSLFEVAKEAGLA